MYNKAMQKAEKVISTAIIYTIVALGLLWICSIVIFTIQIVIAPNSNPFIGISNADGPPKLVPETWKNP
jgi:hypothetical protein